MPERRKLTFPQLLDDVKRRAKARIVPDAHLRQAEVDIVIANIEALRQRTGKITVDELSRLNKNDKSFDAIVLDASIAVLGFR